MCVCGGGGGGGGDRQLNDEGDVHVCTGRTSVCTILTTDVSFLPHSLGTRLVHYGVEEGYIKGRLYEVGQGNEGEDGCVCVC